MKHSVDIETKLDTNWQISDNDVNKSVAEKIFIPTNKYNDITEQVWSLLSHIVISYNTAKKLYNLNYKKNGGYTVGPFFMYNEHIFEYSGNLIYLEDNYFKSFSDFWHENDMYCSYRIYPAYTKSSLVEQFMDILGINFTIINNPIDKNCWLIRIHDNNGNLIEYLRNESNINTFTDTETIANTIYSYILSKYYDFKK